MNIDETIKLYSKFIDEGILCSYFRECSCDKDIKHKMECLVCKSFKLDIIYICNFMYKSSLLKFSRPEISLNNGIII